MNDVRWIVQRPPMGDSSPTYALLERACRSLGLTFCALDVSPGEQVQFPEAAGPAVIHGRKTLMARALEHANYRRAIFFDPDQFTPAAYLEHWGARMLNADQRLLRWNDALEATRSESLFVRPNDDDKLFDGRVFSGDELKAVFEEARRRGHVSAGSLVVVARPREIDAEARLFVVESEVVSGAYYRPNAGSQLPAELIDFARESALSWRPHPVFVMDVARTEGEYKIVEANCFNGSRFYQSDVERVVRRVSQYQSARW